MYTAVDASSLDIEQYKRFRKYFSMPRRQRDLDILLIIFQFYFSNFSFNFIVQQQQLNEDTQCYMTIRAT